MSFDPFESKDALAILKKVCKGKSLTAWRKIFVSVLEAKMTIDNLNMGGVSCKLGEECLALCEVIAVGRGNGGKVSLPVIAEEWLEKAPDLNDELNDLAQRAADKIRTNSGSCAIVQEMGGWPAWTSYCRGLSNRLKKPAKTRKPKKPEGDADRALKFLRDKQCTFEKENGQIVELRCTEKGQLGDADLLEICNLKKLRFLLLTCQKVTDKGLATLSSLKQLGELVINQCDVKGSGFKALNLPGLRALSFGRIGANVVIANCRHLTRLRELQFRASDLTDRGLGMIDFAPSLESLWVDGCKKLKGTGFRKLSGLKKLREIEAGNVAFSPAGLDALAGLTSLRQLNLFQATLPAKRIAALGNLSRLEVLSLNRTGVGDKQLEFLSGLRKLKSLELNGNPNVTDRTVEIISRLPALEEVELSRTGVSSNCIEMLASMKRLSAAGVSFTALTRGEEKKLQRALKRSR